MALERSVGGVEHRGPVGRDREDDEHVRGDERREGPEQERSLHVARQGPRHEEREKAVGEREREEQSVGHAVGREALIIPPEEGKEPQDIDPRVGERLGEPVRDPGEEGEIADVEGPADETALIGRDAESLGARDDGAHSTTTFPLMMWWPAPQNSWQMRRCSPGRSKR